MFTKQQGFDLDGRVAVVTGVAQGIGRATALAFARAGVTIVGVDLNEAGAQAMVDEAEALGAKAVAHVVDVADGDAMAAVIDGAVASFGRLDVLCNNAAAFEPEMIAGDVDAVRTPVSAWDRTFAVNVRGPFLACQRAIPHMLETAGKGAIVNVSSMSGFYGDVNHVAYAASKAALQSLARSISTSHGRKGIRANTVATGLVITETAEANVSGPKMDAYRRHRLVPEPGRPDDVATMIVYLASDHARYITGQTIAMDGGTSSVHQPWYADSHIIHPELVEEGFGR